MAVLEDVLHGRTPPPASLVPLPFRGGLCTNLQTPYEIKSPTCTRKHLNINITNTGKGNHRRWQAPGGQRGQRANSAGRFRHGCTRKYTSRVNPSTNLQTPYEIKLPACTRKHLNINITDTGKGNNRRWQAPGGQRGQRAIPPDGFDMAALENYCPRASLRGDVGIALTPYLTPAAVS